MSEWFINETFDKPTFDPRLTWFNPPQIWRIDNSSLIVEPDAKTDYWQRTHYGFVADNGHFLFTEVEGDFIVTTKVRFNPAHQYDQAGLMVRLSAQCVYRGHDVTGCVVAGDRHQVLVGRVGVVYAVLVTQ